MDQRLAARDQHDLGPEPLELGQQPGDSLGAHVGAPVPPVVAAYATRVTALGQIQRDQGQRSHGTTLQEISSQTYPCSDTGQLLSADRIGAGLSSQTAWALAGRDCPGSYNPAWGVRHLLRNLTFARCCRCASSPWCGVFASRP